MRIAVVGAGSSGLVTLKYLLDVYQPATESSVNLVCFEKGHSIRGCWGNQRPDFISTSTKYTTQFSCFREWQPTVSPAKDFEEFYKGAEFGDYLEAFSERFNLKKHIRFGVELQHIEQVDGAWHLRLSESGIEESQSFDAVFLCTGLVNQKIPIDSAVVAVADDPETIRHATVVVVGGGESAADIANFLAKPEYKNKVFLSLRSGIRVSPRYHPIRGVPSDFLRSRLLLSFNKGARNWVGERFVTFRIRFDRLLAQWFPHQQSSINPNEESQALRRRWDLKLKERAKGGLFNVFHNKSDDFLDAVAQKRLTIIGPPSDEEWNTYFDFDQSTTLTANPDLLVPSTGYRSRLSDISGGAIQLKDFYHGCVHSQMSNLFLVGFARPIIGNIPSISEMQARYAIGVLTGQVTLPTALEARNQESWGALRMEYSVLDVDNVYPVEQYPYCDVLAKEMGIYPSFAKRRSIRTWLKIMLTPASTTHYFDEYFNQRAIEQQRIYTPALLILLMFLIRLVEYPFRVGRPSRP